MVNPDGSVWIEGPAKFNSSQMSASRKAPSWPDLR